MNYVILISTAFILPILFWFHTSHVDSKKQGLTTGQSISLSKKVFSWWTFGMVLVICTDVLGLWIFGPNQPKEPELKLFDVSSYQDEIQRYIKGPNNLKNDDIIEVVRVFRHAEKMIEREMYSEAEIVLQNLRDGKDESGVFVKFDSFVVFNNLGVVSFYLRRNKNFQASDNLLKGSRVKHLDQTSAKAITDNIEKLDSSVNNLD